MSDDVDKDIPGWVLDHSSSYYLVSTHVNGNVEVDGSHDNIEGVMKAKKLTDRLFPGQYEHKMIYVTDVPEGDVEVNEEALNTLKGIIT